MNLDQQIEVRSTTTTPDGYGGFSTATVWLGPIWARVEAVRGQERVIADQERGVQSYRVTVRNAATGATLAAADVLRWQGEEMNVTAAPNAGRAIYRTLEVQTGTPNK